MIGQPYVTTHALERYRLHHPDAKVPDARFAVNQGTPLDPDFIQRLTCRGMDWKGSRYISSPDGRGVFVLDREYTTVITYLRLNSAQQKVLKDPSLNLQEVLAAERTPVLGLMAHAFAAALRAREDSEIGLAAK